MMSPQSDVLACASYWLWHSPLLAGDVRRNSTWDALGHLTPSKRRFDGYPDIDPPRQTLAHANVLDPLLSKAPCDTPNTQTRVCQGSTR